MLFEVVLKQPKKTELFQNQHHISSNEVRCVCTSLFVYSEGRVANTNLEVQTKPPGGAIETVRPFFKFQILFLAHFETS